MEHTVVGDVDDGADTVEVVGRHALNLSLLANQPKLASIRGLAQTYCGGGEVDFVVKAWEHLVQPCVEDFRWRIIIMIGAENVGRKS